MIARVSKTTASLLIALLIWTTTAGCSPLGSSSNVQPHAEVSIDDAAKKEERPVELLTWIVKWRNPDQPDQEILDKSVIVNEIPKLGVTVMKPSNPDQWEQWVEELSAHPEVEYVEQNQQVNIMASSVKPNDKFAPQQSYLETTGVDKAWNQVTKTPDITIALVDTGVDLSHPDLVSNLVNGVNLLGSGKPQDDNGHGTSVAGVIAAAGNNKQGIAGITWSAKLMPIKALDARGYGDEDKLGAGIMYAVDHGADIVVMSVGLYRYSNYMQDIVEYAEKKDVLLVAATGNDGVRLQDKAEVKYPAAYPSVLAVGGSTERLSVEPASNKGPEVDLVAPWDVFTTALGGGYTVAEGTSLSAPQVAGIAALLWTKYPKLTPYQIRAHLQATAQDIGPKGIDASSGYGLVRADKALLTEPSSNPFGSNRTRSEARTYPINTMVHGMLTQSDDGSWYKVNVPYDGVLELALHTISGSGQPHVVRYVGDVTKGEKLSFNKGKMKLSVRKGVHYIHITGAQASAAHPYKYKLASRFISQPDAFEPNDKQYEAYALPANVKQVTGTFSHRQDTDWYQVEMKQKGSLSVKLTTDTARIDPKFEIYGKELIRSVDNHSEAHAEQLVLSNLAPGKYYIKVMNAVNDTPEAVAGHYTLTVETTIPLVDGNEPNDKMYEAVTIVPDADYNGVFDTNADKDWFSLQVSETAYYDFGVNYIPSNRVVDMTVYNKEKKQLLTGYNAKGATAFSKGLILNPGTYYIRLGTDEAFDSQYYKLRVEQKPLVSGYYDIGGHWAKDAIVQATKAGWMSGYGQGEFAPNRTITRAEAAAVLATAFKLPPAPSRTPIFKDVPATHWAHPSIARVFEAGIAAGKGKGTFGPSQPVTRAETAVMLGNALKLQASPISVPPFADVSTTHWAAPMLTELKRLHLIGGYQDGTFAPQRKTTRAEFVVMLEAVMAGQ
ncbi:S8 family peptidase [Paenibacillus aquistagni]|uniref:S8 family peptidase n=1 Tax=Paenibacillus aquistagni TaxID=1852522 RepID=UPI001483C9FA|nr:S8 family serine peptidase [Paenibacillus aquistagni]